MQCLTRASSTYQFKHQPENISVEVVETMDVGDHRLCAAVGHLDWLHRLIEHILAGINAMDEVGYKLVD